MLSLTTLSGEREGALAVETNGYTQGCGDTVTKTTHSIAVNRIETVKLNGESSPQAHRAARQQTMAGNGTRALHHLSLMISVWAALSVRCERQQLLALGKNG